MYTPLKPLPDERQPPLYFAGRTRDLGTLSAELEALCATGQAPGGLQLVTGLPGVGKTQLAMKHIGNVSGRRIGGVEVRALALDPAGLSSTTSLFRSICEALGAVSNGNSIVQIDDRLAGASANARALGAKVGASMNGDVGRHTGDLGMLLRQSQLAGLWKKRALVLVVDELQRIDADGLERLAVLHMNMSNCPIQLVGFGMHHTPKVLANPPGGRPGISRIRPPLELGPLSTVETCDAMVGNLEAMGHMSNLGVTRESAQALANASFGFPQHIRGYLQGADAAIRKHGHLQDGALKDALAQGDANRATYYDQRLAAMGKGPHLLYPLAEHMESAQMENVTTPFAEAAVGRDVVNAAIEHGVMVEGPHGTLSFGIPSFRKHMIAQAAAYQRIARRENAVKSVTR